MHAVPFMRLTAHLAVFHIQLRALLQVSILSHLRIPVFPVHSRRTLQHKTFLWKCVVICSEEPAGWPVFQFAKQPLICYNHCGLRYEECGGGISNVTELCMRRRYIEFNRALSF